MLKTTFPVIDTRGLADQAAVVTLLTDLQAPVERTGTRRPAPSISDLEGEERHPAKGQSHSFTAQWERAFLRRVSRATA
ncbi:hypothetical protein H4696_007851 [Amycolatopsis lexingtonensis]|uniref:Uncharacterized protein n=1 Tax=Amycolatopsis lexingtonensis TaxID=218822 RepID=A0ABR9IC60_9PSEU|nr:hypothetical protein [Amycolatopsis lexingtonensis]MBE1500751.1 hypothetical protein [Amycolatopsis lexingtonensis]